MIQAMDLALDKFETAEFRTAVDVLRVEAMADDSLFNNTAPPPLSTVVDLIVGHHLWVEASLWLISEPSLSPVLLDRLKQYTLVKTQPNVEHPNDVAVLAILLLINDVFGQGSPEFRSAMTIAKNLKNPWWSWQWILSLKAAAKPI